MADDIFSPPPFSAMDMRRRVVGYDANGNPQLNWEPTPGGPMAGTMAGHHYADRPVEAYQPAPQSWGDWLSEAAPHPLSWLDHVARGIDWSAPKQMPSVHPQGAFDNLGNALIAQPVANVHHLFNSSRDEQTQLYPDGSVHTAPWAIDAAMDAALAAGFGGGAAVRAEGRLPAAMANASDEAAGGLGAAKSIDDKLANWDALFGRIRGMDENRIPLSDRFDMVREPSQGGINYHVVPRDVPLWDEANGGSNSVGRFYAKPSQRTDSLGMEVTNARLQEELRRQGLGTKVYDAVGQDFADLGGVVPSPRDQLSNEAQSFWQKRLGHNAFANASDEAAAGAAAARNLDPLGYYSKLDEVLGSLRPTDTVTAQTLAQRGVKASELQARGLDGMLSGGGAKVGDLQAAAKEPVRLNEARYSHDAELQRLENQFVGGTPEQQQAALDARAARNNNQSAKWASYALDKGSNPTYRESVLHLPPSDKAGLSVVDHPSGSGFALQRADGSFYENSPGRPARWGDRQFAENARNDPSGPYDTVNFRSGHWSEPNVVAHMRTSMQRDAAGNPVYHLDELQSDWGQKIRDGGVRDEAKIADLNRQRDTAVSMQDKLADEASAAFGLSPWAPGMAPRYSHNMGMREMLENYAQTGKTPFPNETPSIDQARARALSLRMKDTENAYSRLVAEIQTAQASTPGHPLVNTTDQWTTTALRRALQQAVDSGAEGISLTPGSVQAERFNQGLRNVGGLGYDPERGALYYRDASVPAGPNEYGWRSAGRNVPPEKLQEYVGKEAAQTLLASPRADLMQSGQPLNGSYHRLDFPQGMELGGEGMKTAYDQMYPKILGKELSKLDPSIKRQVTTLQGHEDKGPFSYWPLTDKAKEEIRKGLPLFSNASAPAAGAFDAHNAVPDNVAEILRRLGL